MGAFRDDRHRALLDGRATRGGDVGAGGTGHCRAPRPATLHSRPGGAARRGSRRRPDRECLPVRRGRSADGGGPGDRAPPRRDSGRRADRGRRDRSLLGLVWRTRRRPHHQRVSRADGRRARGGARPRAPTAGSSLTRGSGARRAVQPGAPQQIPASTHRLVEGGRRGRPRLRSPGGATASVRHGATRVTQRVLVTGGAGYIGSILVDQLLERDYRAFVLDDLSTGHAAAVASGASFVHGNVGNRELVEALLTRERIESVVHMAAFALVSESVAQPQKYVTNNVTAARVLLEAVAGAGVRRFVFSSSCAVYGHPARVPITEDTPQAPVNPYGETKREFEALLAEFGPRHGVEVVSLRYFNAAGATQRLGEDHDPETHLIPNVLAVALGKQPAVNVYGTDYPTPDGTAVRDYVHVVDIADAHIRALEVPLRDGRHVAVNLG